MSIVITISQKGARLDAIEKIVEKYVKEKYPDASISVQKKEPAKSRGDRFSEAQSLLSEAKSIAEELSSELEEWLGNLPENLQGGSKADEIQSAIDDLETFTSACEEAEGVESMFPGMY